MKNIVGILVFGAFCLALALGARATFWPKVPLDDVVNVGPFQTYGTCYEPNSGNRKIIIDIASVDNVPLEVGILPKPHFDAALAGQIMKDPKFLQSSAVTSSYSPSVIRSTVRANTEGDYTAWCLVVHNKTAKNAVVEVKMKLLYRP